MKKAELKCKTDYLLPKNNFWVGMGSVLNLYGRYFDYNYSKGSNLADYKAIHCDWRVVGEDIKKAKKDFERINADKLCLK